MHYLVRLGQEPELHVLLEPLDAQTWQASLGSGRTHALALRGQRPDGSFLVEVDGELLVFDVHARDEGLFLEHDGERLDACVTPLGKAALHAGRGKPLARRPRPPAALTSPITGIILDVLVQPGQTVRRGQPLVVLEAMKMENTLVAQSDACVGAITVCPGEQVFAGQTLLELDA